MDRESAADKIRKLLALAENAGATEQEAETAMRMAEGLMRKHSIERGEIREEEREGWEWKSVIIPLRVPVPLTTAPQWFGVLSLAVARFCDCKVTYKELPKYGMCALYQGDAVDLVYAAWLIKRLRDLAWKLGGEHSRYERDQEDFRYGLAARLAKRMKEMREERTQAFTAGTGTALIVVRDKLALRDAQFGPQTSRAAKGRESESARAGREAGATVGFGRPVAGRAGPKLLG